MKVNTLSTNSIPEQVIDAVLKHHHIAEVVGKYVHLTKRGRNLIGLCPFHSEKTPSFTVSSEKNIFNCFGCGVGGNVIKFLMEIESYSFVEAVRQLAEEAQIPFQWRDHHREHSGRTAEQDKLIEAHELTAKWFHYVLKNSEQGQEAMNYLLQRGFNEQLIDTFQIGYAPPIWDALTQFLSKKGFEPTLMEQGGLLAKRSSGDGHVDRFRNRIMFPIYDNKGKVIAFAGRALSDEEQPKYLNTPETTIFNKRKSLYNFHEARAAIRKTRSIVLFEGYADVIQAWHAGIQHGVATMGTSLTDEHIALLRRTVDQVTICYDGDDAGQAAAFQSLSLLEKHNLTVHIAVLPDGLDPDDYILTHGGRAFVKHITQSALAATKFKLEYIKKDYVLHSDQGRLSYIEAAVEMIAGLRLPTEREHYLQHLSSEFDYSLDALQQQMFQTRQKLQKKHAHRDNNENTWNNVMNERRATVNTPALLPAYHNAERHLLCLMMHNRHISTIVEQELADQFNVETHAALAAYLYAFYADNDMANVSQFLTTLQDEKLESIATAISLLNIDHNSNIDIINDYMKQIKNYHTNKQLLDEKKLEMKRAERAGQLMLAAQIATDINTLERKLKLRNEF